MKVSLCAESETLSLQTFDSALVTDRYLAWLRDNRVNKYLLKPSKNTTLTDISEYVSALLKSENDHFLSITDKESGLHIGNVRLGPIDWEGRVCQYSMMIGDTSFHGRGVGSEVVSLATNLCFKQLGMTKVFLDVIEENKAAVRIYEKNGFVVEGRLRQHKKLDEKVYDLLIMSLFASKGC